MDRSDRPLTPEEAAAKREAARLAAAADTWSEEAERRMRAIDGASQLVQTTYMMERVYHDLLQLYEALGTNFDTPRARTFNGERVIIRQRAENLELHIKLMLQEITREERSEEEARDRRTRTRRDAADRRRQDDRRHETVDTTGGDGGKAA